MRIQEAFSNCCHGLKDFTVTAAHGIGKGLSTGSAYVMDLAKRSAAAAKPHMQHLMTLAKENKVSLLACGIAAAVGATIYAVFSHFCCHKTHGKGRMPSSVAPLSSASV